MAPRRSTESRRPAAAALLAFLGATSLATAAQAAVTTLTFGGTIGEVDAPLLGTFHTGDAVSITLRYDTSAPDLVAPNPNTAAYAYLDFDITFGGYTASFGDQFPNSLDVLNDTDQGLGPADAFGATALQTGAGAAVGGLLLQQGFLSLWDFTRTAFSGTDLPEAPSIGAFSYRVAGLTYCTNPGCGVGSDASSVFADITSMSMTTSVPEPGSAALVLAAGLALLVSPRRRGGKRSLEARSGVEPD